jgi:hypothetical protein
MVTPARSVGVRHSRMTNGLVTLGAPRPLVRRSRRGVMLIMQRDLRPRREGCSRPFTDMVALYSQSKRPVLLKYLERSGESEGGLIGNKTGLRRVCVKSKSLVKLPSCASSSRTSGRGSGRPSVLGRASNR